MKLIFKVVLLAFACSLAGPGFSDGLTLVGWQKTGNAPNAYDVIHDREIAFNGSGSARISSTGDLDGSQFGAIAQSIDASQFSDKRLRFMSFVSTKDVRVRASLWVRIDDKNGNILAFDNLSGKVNIRENSDWAPYKVVIDVPSASKRISYGLLLQGPGTAWIDNASLSIVDSSEVVTGNNVVENSRISPPPNTLPVRSVNLDFELPLAADITNDSNH